MSSSNDEGGQGRVPPPVRVGGELRWVWFGAGVLKKIKILEVRGQWCRVLDVEARSEKWMNWDCVASFEVVPIA